MKKAGGKVYRKISCLVTNSGIPEKSGRHIQSADLGVIKDAALVTDTKGRVAWVGQDAKLPRIYRHLKSYDASGLCAYPGFVDPHTHLAFAGSREHEFSLRLAGAKYQEIAAAGGGILSSVKATRKISQAQLAEKITERLAVAAKFGVRLLEAKSGYGLDQASEIKSLAALAEGERLQRHVSVVRTCLAAHAVPKEFREKPDDWVQLVCKKILPKVVRAGLAEFVDVFCDSGFFSTEQTRTILSAAQALGLKTRIHGDELANLEAANLAVEMGCRSVDHCLKISARGISALAGSNTVAILLPATSLFLRESPAPARALVEAGVIVALATDFNPGTSPTQNLPLVASLGTLVLGLTVPETIAAITWNGAFSLDRQNDYGCLLPGYRACPVFSPGQDPAAICYNLAPAELVDPCS